MPPVPVYENLVPGADVLTVAAADKGRGSAVVNCSASTHEVDYYEDGSSTPRFSLFPPVSPTAGCPEVKVCADSSRLAIGYTAVSGLATVDVWDTQSPNGTLLQTLTVPVGGYRHHDFSGDGSTVLIGTDNHDWLYDVNNGTLIFDDGTTVSQDAHSVNVDGTAWGRGGFDLGAWVLNAGTYHRVLTFNDTSLGFPVYAASISADGSTFAAASYDATSPAKFRVYCFALTPSSSSLLWTYAKNGLGTFTDYPAAVSLSDDGRYIGVGSWGTANNSHPEALLFDRDAGNVPIGSIDTPGSVFDLDLSGDGQFLVAGTKAVHANTFGNGGAGYSFDRGGQGFWLSGTVSLPGQATLNVGGTPGDSVLLSRPASACSPCPRRTSATSPAPTTSIPPR